MKKVSGSWKPLLFSQSLLFLKNAASLKMVKKKVEDVEVPFVHWGTVFRQHLRDVHRALAAALGVTPRQERLSFAHVLRTISRAPFLLHV